MDDTIADFVKAATVNGIFDYLHMYEPGFFFSLQPIEGSQVAVRQLIALGYDVQILSQPVADSHFSYSDKIRWIGCYFPELLHKVNLTQDKGLFKGDYLIDDNYFKWKDKFEANGGKFIHFMYNPGSKTEFSNRQCWENIVNFFREEAQNDKEKESAQAQSESQRENGDEGREQ